MNKLARLGFLAFASYLFPLILTNRSAQSPS
jgi:hypothetical protein